MEGVSEGEVNLTNSCNHAGFSAECFFSCCVVKQVEGNNSVTRLPNGEDASYFG